MGNQKIKPKNEICYFFLKWPGSEGTKRDIKILIYFVMALKSGRHPVGLIYMHFQKNNQECFIWCKSMR